MRSRVRHGSECGQVLVEHAGMTMAVAAVLVAVLGVIGLSATGIGQALVCKIEEAISGTSSCSPAPPISVTPVSSGSSGDQGSQKSSTSSGGDSSDSGQSAPNGGPAPLDSKASPSVPASPGSNDVSQPVD